MRCINLLTYLLTIVRLFSLTTSLINGSIRAPERRARWMLTQQLRES